MSLKTIPFLGKSGTSRIYVRRSMGAFRNSVPDLEPLQAGVEGRVRRFDRFPPSAARPLPEERLEPAQVLLGTLSHDLDLTVVEVSRKAGDSQAPGRPHCEQAVAHPLDSPAHEEPGRAHRESWMVGASGFEPPTPWSRTRCATRLRYAPTIPSKSAHLMRPAGGRSRHAPGRPHQPGSSRLTRLPGTSASSPSSNRTQALVPPS